MDRIALFSSLAFIISISAYIPYVKSILASESRPTISTYLSWGLLDLAIFFGMWSKGMFSWLMLAYVVGTGVLVGVSLYKKARVGWTPLDTQCIVGAAIGAVLYLITGDSNVAIVVSLLTIIIATLPMIRNLHKNPSTKSFAAWLFFFAGGVAGVIGISEWSIAGALTPIVFVVIQATMVWLISRKFV